MDYGSLMFAVGIALYGVFEYTRREDAHKKAMELLRRDIVPPDTAATPSASTITTTTLVAALLLVVIVILIVVAMKNEHTHYPILWLAVFFGGIVGFLIAMVIRDTKQLRQSKNT